MRYKLFFIFVLILSSQIIFAQLKGLVLDSVSNEAIPYVNIWVQNADIGTSSDINGKFILTDIEADKVLIFSAVGYKTKRIIYKPALHIVKLQQDTVELSEVIIKSKQKHKELKIGKFNKSKISFYYGCNGTPWMHARFFAYEPVYIETPYLKNITILTNSQIKNAKFIVRLYTQAENGKPDKYLYNKPIIGNAKKGNKRTKIDLSEFKISFPKKGIFISVEWLIIEENKYAYKYTMGRHSKKKHDGIAYQPSFGNIIIETNKNAWIFNKGRWDKPKKFKTIHFNNKYTNKFPVLACELTLTN